MVWQSLDVPFREGRWMSMEQLAIFGGIPVREDRIFYGRQCIEQDDIEAVVETLKGDLITCGPKVEGWGPSCVRSPEQNTRLLWPTARRPCIWRLWRQGSGKGMR